MDRRAGRKAGRGPNAGRGGGYLPALPPQAENARQHGKGARAGAIGPAPFAAGPGGTTPCSLHRGIPGEELPDAQAALAGARDIIAEAVSDDADARAELRRLYLAGGMLVSKAAKDGAESVYDKYYDFKEPVKKAAGHRVLAVDRGEREGFLKVSIEVDAVQAGALLEKRFVKNSSAAAREVRAAVQDAYTRLVHPSLEREVRAMLTAQACEGAIKVFSKNLEQLLLTPPIKGKVALGLDPGYRMGCKTAVVDATG